jgi:hypothetical protein
VSTMPPMLAYTIHGNILPGGVPYINIVQGYKRNQIAPANPADDSYWIVILDANNPNNKVQEAVVPGQNNSTVPAGLDFYMSNPGYLFAIVTQYLNSMHVPQGDFYDYLVSHGAGRELQRLEQINASLGCAVISQVSYVLTGQCGPANSGSPAYEAGSFSTGAMLLMSLMPLPNGQPPYSLCDTYTFTTRPQAKTA